MAAATILVTGEWLSADGKPLRGDIEFVPSAPVADTLLHARKAVTPVTVKLDQSGRISKRLTATSGPDVLPSGWVWLVTEHLLGVVQRAQYPLSLPHTTQGGAVDLLDVAPVAGISPVVYGPVFGTVYDGGTP